MEQLGLGAARTRNANFSASGAYGSAREISWGKDTSSGHWEMMGAPVEFDWGYFPEAPSFNSEIIERLCSEGKIPGILGNCHASGTEIIARLGDEHIGRTHQQVGGIHRRKDVLIAEGMNTRNIPVESSRCKG